MNDYYLLAVLFFLALLILLLMSVRQRFKGNAEDITPVGSPSPPGFAVLLAQSIERLAALPHFRKLLTGDLCDFYMGTLTTIDECEDYPYPHLVLQYGNGNQVALVTDAALMQYVALQEAVAAQLKLPQKD